MLQPPRKNRYMGNQGGHSSYCGSGRLAQRSAGHYIRNEEKTMQTRTCLNGYWDFLPFPNAMETDAALAAGGWITDTYLVPSSWRSALWLDNKTYNLDFFDIFEYPKEWNDVHRGALRKILEIDYVPGTRVFLRLDAVGKQARILANGVQLAETDDMFLPVEAELTSLLSPGENRVEIVVICEPHPSILRQDELVKLLVPSGSWYAGVTMGIWQDAWLVVRPETYLLDPFVLTSFRDKTISFTVERSGSITGEVVGEVLDADGEVVLTLQENCCTHWENPHLWMPDDPYLYTLRMKLTENGETVDELCQRFGFREVWNVKHKLYVNGVRMNLRGDAWHYQGLAMQRREYADNWCRFAKEQGINYIRPHAIPYPQCFYDAADESGMFIMAESGIYGSSKAMQADDPRFIDACARHLRRFAREYRNHPSVILWSMQNEMRWVDGREDFKLAIPMLMDVMAKEDPSGRLVSCDGDNRLLTDEMMQAVSMHYNIDGRISDWNKEKPLFFGEQGAFHYVSPQNSCDFQGEKSFTSFWNAMEGLAMREAQFLQYARREEVTGVTPFNYCNYMNKAMPFADMPVDPGDITAPGPHPKMLRAGCLTLNNGQMTGYPSYIPQPALRALQQATAPIAILPEEMNTRFLAGKTVSRSFRVYNDTCRDETASLSCVAETDSGHVLLASEEVYAATAGSNRLVTYTLALPDSLRPYGVTVRFTLRHGGKLVLEDTFRYEISPAAKAPAVHAATACLGPVGSVPAWAADSVTYYNTPAELAGASADILIIGEDTPFSQEELQPVLDSLTSAGKVRAILILKQTEFAPGQLVLSKKPFFSAHPTGEHPVLAGLTSEDLRFWGPANVEESEEGWMIASGFELPREPGYRVILECGWGDWGWGGMNWCGLMEGTTHGVPVLMTQLRLTEFANEHPAAQVLYRNCLHYLAAASVTETATPVICTADELAEASCALEQGKTVIVTGAAPKHSTMLTKLLGRPVTVQENPTYQVERVAHPLMRSVSNSQLTGLEKVTYSASSLSNEYAALYSLEAENVQWLLSGADTPWAELFIDGMQTEGVKVACATLQSNAISPARCYGFAAPAGKGTLVVLQLRQDGMEKFRRCVETVAMNAGAVYETGMFASVKKPMHYSIPGLMWLAVDPRWNYEDAVAYHADPQYLLNNLGEGSYGWMQRVSVEDGVATLKDSADSGVFLMVFMDCALNHDPEKREPGEIPDPSIVPDVTVTCNAAFNLYVNGRKFEGFREAPESAEDIVLEDVLLHKGINRLFFEVFPVDRDVVLGAVFRDKLGAYLADAKYYLTLD